MKKVFILPILSLSLFFSCNKEEEKTTENEGTNTSSAYQLIKKDTTDTDHIIKLFAKTSTLDMGYHPLYMKIKNLGGEELSTLSPSLLPMMDMGTMKHSSPVVQPTYNSEINMYEGAAIFTMASTMGEWELKTIVEEDTTDLELNVLESQAGFKHVGSYNGMDGEKYIVSLVRPNDWKVGINDVEIMVHKKENMMSFPAVEGLTIYMDPQMTSMGHGSPHNISPVDVGNGVYAGKVNYTMTGDWRLNLDLIKEGDTIVNANIDILF